MSLTAASLPREILTIVSHLIAYEDQFACVHVCRNWAIAFTPILYATVTILNSRQCSLFYDTLLASARRHRRCTTQRAVLGHCVRKLRIVASRPRAEMVRRLPELCPYLREFDISNDPGFVSTDSDATWYRAADLTRLPSSAGYDSLPLTQLSLTCEYGVLSLDWLEGMHGLRDLHINWSKQMWTFERMEQVHRWCPQLEALHLALDRSNFSKTDLVGLRPPDGCAPATAMRRISLMLPYQCAEYQAAAWLLYFAAKYPGLRTVVLDTNPTHHYSMAFALEYMDAPVLGSSVETARLQAYRAFAEGCRELETVHLKDLGLYRHFFQALWEAGHTKLRHLEIDEIRNFPSGTIAQCFDWWKDSLCSLALKGATYMPMNINLPWSLRTLSHLTHLEIVRPYGKLPIALLLDCATRLQSLALCGTDLCTTMQLYTTVHRRYSTCVSGQHLPPHPLRRLVIRGHNRLSEKVLNYVGRRCLALRHLELDYCVLTDTAKDARAAIALPRQSLTSIALNGVSLLRPAADRSGSPIEVFAVRTAGAAPSHTGSSSTRCDNYRWYDLSETGNCDRVLGQVASRRRGAVLQLKDHLTIQCHSVDRLYIGQRRLLL